jgi:hypothetical protein
MNYKFARIERWLAISRVVTKNVLSTSMNSQLDTAPIARLGHPWKEERYSGD